MRNRELDERVYAWIQLARRHLETVPYAEDVWAQGARVLQDMRRNGLLGEELADL